MSILLPNTRPSLPELNLFKKGPILGQLVIGNKFSISQDGYDKRGSEAGGDEAEKEPCTVLLIDEAHEYRANHARQTSRSCQQAHPESLTT